MMIIRAQMHLPFHSRLILFATGLKKHRIVADFLQILARCLAIEFGLRIVISLGSLSTSLRAFLSPGLYRKRKNRGSTAAPLVSLWLSGETTLCVASLSLGFIDSSLRESLPALVRLLPAKRRAHGLEKRETFQSKQTRHRTKKAADTATEVNDDGS